MNKKRRILHSGLVMVFIVYIFFLLEIIMLKSGIGINDFRHIQIIPFMFLVDFFKETSTTDVLMKNVLGNIAIFIPLGLTLPCFFKKLTFKKTILIGLCLSICFEIIQFVIGIGMSDIDDIILNTTGAALGAFIHFKIFKSIKTEFAMELATFLFLVIFGIFGLVSLWKYNPSMLPAQINYVNQEILGDKEEESFDLMGKCISIKDGEILVEIKEEDKTKEESYKIAKDGIIIEKIKEFQYSENGNIQKQTVTYKEVSQEEANKDLESDQHKFKEKLWLDKDGNCTMMIMTIIKN